MGSWKIRLDASVNDLEQAGEEVGVQVDGESPHIVEHQREEGSIQRADRGGTSRLVGRGSGRGSGGRVRCVWPLENLLQGVDLDPKQIGHLGQGDGVTVGAEVLLKLSCNAAQVRDCCQHQPKYLQSLNLSGILFRKH